MCLLHWRGHSFQTLSASGFRAFWSWVRGTLHNLMLLDWFLVAFIPKTALYTGNGMFSELRVGTMPLVNLAWPSRAAARAIQLKQSLDTGEKTGPQPEEKTPETATRQSIWKMQLLCSSRSSCPRGDPARWRCCCFCCWFCCYCTLPFSFLKNKEFVVIQFLSQNGEGEFQGLPEPSWTWWCCAQHGIYS